MYISVVQQLVSWQVIIVSSEGSRNLGMGVIIFAVGIVLALQKWNLP